MPNPLFGNKVSPNGATAPTDPLYDTPKKYARGYNKFNLTRQFFNTERYADITPIEALEGVEGDRLPFGNKHEIRSYTFKSPKMFDIYKKKTYFMVDNKAILPINWEKVYKQPNKGDDVTDNVNCVSNLLGYVFASIQSSGFRSWDFSAVNVTAFLRYMLFLESLFSNGSLLASFNCHLSSMLRCYSPHDLETDVTFDRFFDELFSSIPDIGFTIEGFGNVFFTEDTSVTSVGSSYTVIHDKRTLFDLLRTFPYWQVNLSLITNTEALSTWFRLTGGFFDECVNVAHNVDDFDDFTINLSRLVAYQLVCVQFFTRDSVDNIYTSEMYMDNLRSIYISMISNAGISTQWPSFTYNGTRYDYDVCSGSIIDYVINRFLSFSNGYSDAYRFIHALFFYRKSLRYGDYFTAAKTLPYAPGDVTADVVANGVSALDMTRSILMQRFLNSVERARNTWKDYLKDVTDGIAPPNPLEPRFLASSTSLVGGFEVENTTSQNQGNIVTLLKSGNSNYVYEVEVGSPCIIIGVSTYEVPRVYSNTIEKFFFHRDRFDMFNKFMQNIGDQEIYNFERNSFFSPESIFGYQPRHLEYKKRYPVASGGFVEFLNGYSFITDNQQSGFVDNNLSDSANKISSYYIRNKNVEFDRFYSSLSGLSLASYFHFICKYDCICHAQRKMEYSPSIL